MIRICSDCGKDMGEKPPYEDTSVTHGMCPDCVDKVRETLREMREGRENIGGKSHERTYGPIICEQTWN